MVGLGPPEEEKGPALPTRGLRRRAVQGLSICDYTVHMLSAALPNARPCAAQGCPQGSKHGPRPRPPAQKSCSQRRGERLHSLMSNIFLSCFLHFGCTEWLAGSWFPNQGWHPCPLKGNGIKAIYCHPAYLIYMQSTSCEILGWMNHKLESMLPGEISTSHVQMILL